MGKGLKLLDMKLYPITTESVVILLSIHRYKVILFQLYGQAENGFLVVELAVVNDMAQVRQKIMCFQNSS